MNARLGAVLSIVILLVGACADSLSPPQGWNPEGPIDCRVELSAESVGLMQPVDLTLWVYFERTAPPVLTDPPIPAGFAGELETDMRPYADGWLIRRVFHLRPTNLGSLTIESMKVRFDEHETTTPALQLEVTTVLGGEHDPKSVEDPAALFPAQMSLQPFLIGAVVLAVLAALILWWRRRSRRVVPLPTEVPLPPHVKALRALERLRQSERHTEAQIEMFYVGVSHVLRVYLEERFGLHAPLRSTEEFLVDLEAGDDLSLAQRQSLRQFLQQCDLVKFARMFPETDSHDQILRIAENLVGQTRDDVIQTAEVTTDATASETVGGAV